MERPFDPREEVQEHYHDSLERDCDEQYIPEPDDINEGEPDYDDSVDEAQEWYDFDPDC